MFTCLWLSSPSRNLRYWCFLIPMDCLLFLSPMVSVRTVVPNRAIVGWDLILLRPLAVPVPISSFCSSPQHSRWVPLLYDNNCSFTKTCQRLWDSVFLLGDYCFQLVFLMRAPEDTTMPFPFLPAAGDSNYMFEFRHRGTQPWISEAERSLGKISTSFENK